MKKIIKKGVVFSDQNLHYSELHRGRGSLKREGNTLKIDLFRDSKIITLSPVTFLIVVR